MKSWVTVVLIFSIGLGYSQINLGEVTDSLAIKNHASETYSLYLPTQYSENSLNAIVFIFDPGGRGLNGINPFVEAAEKYNYILVCSNNAKNGPMQQNFDIANRLFSTVFETYNIDPKQIYVAGFSGGSRFSTAIAVLTNQMQGVIACGSGFPDDINYSPTSPNFTYAGIVGNRDMNYSEMSNNKIYLNKLNFTNDLFVFDGDHRWPPSEVITDVFGWLEIMAYRKNIRRDKKAVISEIYNDMYSDSEKTSDLIMKEALLNRMVKGFGALVKTDSIRKKLKELRSSPDFKAEKKALKDIFDQEEELILKFTSRFHTDYKKPKRAKLKWWKDQIGKLNTMGERSSAKKDMSERLKYKLFELAYTRSNPNYFPVNEEQQKLCYDIIRVLYPERYTQN